MAKKAGRRGGKGGKRTAKRTSKKKRARKPKDWAKLSKDYKGPIGPGMSKKGQVPLRVLEKRLVKLNSIVLKRGGRYLAG